MHGQYGFPSGSGVAFGYYPLFLRKNMPRKKSRWLPPIGSLATYIGRASRLARGGYNVRIVAETCADRMVVEAIGRSGFPVRFTVKRENLAPLQPGLFDQAA